MRNNDNDLTFLQIVLYFLVLASFAESCRGSFRSRLAGGVNTGKGPNSSSLAPAQRVLHI